VPRRRKLLVALACASVVLAGCGGGDDEANDGAGGQVNTTTTTLVRAPATTVTTVAIPGVETFVVVAGHSEAPVSYPQVPPAGGLHNPQWQPCGFYAEPVPNEKGVHSLEHGAIWITYRPDLPQAEIDTLATLARSRNLVLVSRWDSGLPAPIVLTAWGRQLRLDSVTDPRVLEFIRRYVNQGPEVNAPC
jgi:hypothetical protein